MQSSSLSNNPIPYFFMCSNKDEGCSASGERSFLLQHERECEFRPKDIPSPPPPPTNINYAGDSIAGPDRVEESVSAFIRHLLTLQRIGEDEPRPVDIPIPRPPPLNNGGGGDFISGAFNGTQLAVDRALERADAICRDLRALQRLMEERG